eukprot:TRINITY_DN3895_c0_g2_i1.p1 TRINITY_DN3895_c0_g2~~TRINITY_DN3895_c0_g2_i1.p1  ORF type:complete len:242 (-),score=61.63 TRINITY_DN3895_c0_g2_i1:362-1087(-)
MSVYLYDAELSSARAGIIESLSSNEVLGDLCGDVVLSTIAAKKGLTVIVNTNKNPKLNALVKSNVDANKVGDHVQVHDEDLITFLAAAFAKSVERLPTLLYIQHKVKDLSLLRIFAGLYRRVGRSEANQPPRLLFRMALPPDDGENLKTAILKSVNAAIGAPNDLLGADSLVKVHVINQSNTARRYLEVTLQLTSELLLADEASLAPLPDLQHVIGASDKRPATSGDEPSPQKRVRTEADS